jgi:hypothetical protein
MSIRRTPPSRRLHWAQYCREYGAYGVPVYFVDDGWYRANVMRRNWTPEQRSWSQQQWIEQDRVARDHVERQRFEQQQRWNDQRAWRDQQQRQGDDPRGQGQQGRGQGEQGRGQGGLNHDRGDPDRQNRMRWGSAHGFVPPQGQNNPVPRPQVGGQWQQEGGQQPQPPAASQPRGGSGHDAGDRRGADRGQDRDDRRGQGDTRGAYEHGRDARRDR